jgi:hypothetical protein
MIKQIFIIIGTCVLVGTILGLSLSKTNTNHNITKKTKTTSRPTEIKTIKQAEIPTAEPINKKLNKNRIIGKTYIDKLEIKNNDVIIVYSEETLKKMPLIDIKDYNYYFLTGNKIKKILIGESLRLFYYYIWVENTEISISADGYIYNLKLNREKVNNYLKKPYTKDLITEYIYNKNKQLLFLEHFKGSKSIK